MIRRPPRSTPLYSSAASDVYKRQVVERSGDGPVVGLHVAPDAVADFRWIRARLIGRVEGDDLALSDRRGEIVGEGRDPASVWRIGRDVGGFRDRVAPVVARRLRDTARWALWRSLDRLASRVGGRPEGSMLAARRLG